MVTVDAIIDAEVLRTVVESGACKNRKYDATHRWVNQEYAEEPNISKPPNKSSDCRSMVVGRARQAEPQRAEHDRQNNRDECDVSKFCVEVVLHDALERYSNLPYLDGA